MEEKKGKSFGILLGVRASYEIIFQLIYTFASKRNHAVYSEATALILSLVFSVLVIAGCIYMFRPLLKDFPVGKEPKSRPLGGRRTAGEEDRKSRQAWSEVRSMNKPKPSIAELAASGNPSDTEEAENEH